MENENEKSIEQGALRSYTCDKSTKTIFGCFSWFLFRKKCIYRIISSLSDEEKKEIIRFYIIDQIRDLCQQIECDKKKSAFAVRVIQEYNQEKAILENIINNNDSDADEVNERIGLLNQEISFFEREYEPFKKRIFDNLVAKKKLEEELNNL